MNDFQAEDELLKKNRHTVGFYRATTPTILTVDEELIRLVFATHFGSFPTRVPGGGSVGAGPIFGHTLDAISDMPRWKRLRSTLAVGFSTRQLNEMVVAINNSIGEFSVLVVFTSPEKTSGLSVDQQWFLIIMDFQCFSSGHLRTAGTSVRSLLATK